MSLSNILLRKHKLKDYAIIEYNNGEEFVICCAISKGKKDYYDIENKRRVYGWEVTHARRLSIFTTINPNEYLGENQAVEIANENLTWFKNQIKYLRVSKIEHEVMDCEDL